MKWILFYSIALNFTKGIQIAIFVNMPFTPLNSVRDEDLIWNCDSYNKQVTEHDNELINLNVS